MNSFAELILDSMHLQGGISHIPGQRQISQYAQNEYSSKKGNTFY